MAIRGWVNPPFTRDWALCQASFPELARAVRNSEEFTNDFINSIRDDEGSSFKQIYRNVEYASDRRYPVFGG